MSDAFEEFQARVRANARIHTEADLYWRTNRWEENGSMKFGPILVVDGRENVGRSSVAEHFEKLKEAAQIKYRR